MSEWICHQRKPTQTKDLEEDKETRNVVTCRVGRAGLIWMRRKWYETKRKWCFPLGDECTCPFTQAAPVRSLSEQEVDYHSLVPSNTPNKFHAFLHFTSRERHFVITRYHSCSNHNTAHCSVRCSMHALAVLRKAKFVFKLLSSPGRILLTSENNV